MGNNNQSFNRSIASQERYVRTEMAKMNSSNNYVSHNR